MCGEKKMSGFLNFPGYTNSGGGKLRDYRSNCTFQKPSVCVRISKDFSTQYKY